MMPQVMLSPHSCLMHSPARTYIFELSLPLDFGYAVVRVVCIFYFWYMILHTANSIQGEQWWSMGIQNSLLASLSRLASESYTKVTAITTV